MNDWIGSVNEWMADNSIIIIDITKHKKGARTWIYGLLLIIFIWSDSWIKSEITNNVDLILIVNDNSIIRDR